MNIPAVKTGKFQLKVVKYSWCNKIKHELMSVNLILLIYTFNIQINHVRDHKI